MLDEICVLDYVYMASMITILLMVFYHQIDIYNMMVRLDNRFTEYIGRDVKMHQLHAREYNTSLLLLKESVNRVTKDISKSMEAIKNLRETNQSQINYINNNMTTFNDKISKCVSNMCNDLDKSFTEINQKILIHERILNNK